MTGHLLSMIPGGSEGQGLQGIPTTEPAFGLPAMWIPEREREKARSFEEQLDKLTSKLTTLADG